MSKHKIISFIKSGIRIVGCIFGMLFFWGNFFPMHAFAFFLLAEVLGVIEEFFEVASSPVLSEYTDWSGISVQHLDPLEKLASEIGKEVNGKPRQTWIHPGQVFRDSDIWKNGPDGASFGSKE